MTEYVVILTTCEDVFYKKLTDEDNEILEEVDAQDWIINTLGIGDMVSYVFITSKPKLKELNHIY